MPVSIVPTTENTKRIRVTDGRKGYNGIKKNGNTWMLVVDKPAMGSESDDWKVCSEKYDVNDYIFHKYHFFYKKEEDWLPIPNPYLENSTLSAYALCKTGMWGIINNILFYLDANNELIKLGKIYNIIEMQMMPDGKLKLTILKGIRQTVENHFYSRMMGDFEGYEDEYELMVETRYVPRQKYEDLIRKELEKKRKVAEPVEIDTWVSTQKPQGTERYFKLQKERYCRSLLKEWTPTYLECAEKVGRWYHTTGYDDGNVQEVYHLDRGYLFVSNVEGTYKKCLCEVGETGQAVNDLVVNDKGIFVILSSESDACIEWHTREGKLLKKIALKGNIIQTYICGNLIFYIRSEEGGYRINSAYWMNMENETETCIFHGHEEKARKNKKLSSGNKKSKSAEYIMGNERGAVLRLAFVCRDYEDGIPDEEILDDDAEGWYYYDFKAIYCLTESERDPHLLYTKPLEYQKWIAKWQHMIYKKKIPSHDNIVAFNMAKNLMWVTRQESGENVWIPMNITADPQKRSRPDLPVWQIPVSDIRDRLGLYFDGERCYFYSSSNNECICSVNSKGQREEWPIERYASWDGMIYRLGNHVFAEGRLPGTCSEINGYLELKEKPLHDMGVFVFPASHKFQKILSIFQDYTRSFGTTKEIEWMIEAFKRGEQADSIAYGFYEMEQQAARKAREEAYEKACEQQRKREQEFAAKKKQDSMDSGLAGDEISGKPVYEKEEKNISIPTSQLEYWERFCEYVHKAGLDPNMKLTKTADRNWYAIRLGNAVVRIECSVNSRKESIRTAFFVQEAPEVFALAQCNRAVIESALEQLGEIVWDDVSKAANISIYTSRAGKSTEEQYEWFCNTAVKLYETVFPYLNLQK